jgi:hypothetical protein
MVHLFKKMDSRWQIVFARVNPRPCDVTDSKQSTRDGHPVHFAIFQDLLRSLSIERYCRNNCTDRAVRLFRERVSTLNEQRKRNSANNEEDGLQLILLGFF